MELTAEQKNRYARQIAVPEVGKEGQKKICNAKILIIGSGALGSMVAMQLAGAGIGNLGIADFDTIEETNLQRQFFFKTQEAGQFKVDVLSENIQSLNPAVKVNKFRELINIKKAEQLFALYDFIIDATDNPESKKITGIVSKKIGKGCCIGGVRDFDGQVMTLLPYDPRPEDFFGEASAEGFLPCSIGGVMGPAAAFCASLQSSEAIKYITGKGSLLSGKIFLFSLLKNSFKIFHL